MARARRDPTDTASARVAMTRALARDLLYDQLERMGYVTAQPRVLQRPATRVDWSKERCVSAVARFMVLYGRPPRTHEWENCTVYGLPGRETCRRHCGTLGQAVRVARRRLHTEEDDAE